MLDKYPIFKRGEIQTIRDKFPKGTKQFLKDYFEYRMASGLKDISNLERYVCHIRHIIEKPFEKFDDYKEHVKLINIIKGAMLSEGVKFNILVDMNNLFEYVFPIMWKRDNKFSELYVGKKGKKKPIFVKPAFNESDLVTKEEIDKMLQAENDLSWKTFLLITACCGARNTETRHIINADIIFDEDGTSRSEIFMTKNNKPKLLLFDKVTTGYIKRLQDKLKEEDKFWKYLFPSKYKNMKGEPMTRSNVCDRIGELSQKAIGRRITPHKFRHRKATEYYKLVQEGKISESTALKLMGHGKSMMSTYNHTPKDEELAILKKQAFNPEMPKDERDMLMKRLDDLEKSNKDIREQNKKIIEQSEDFLKSIQNQYEDKVFKPWIKEMKKKLPS